jgi:RHS repeat-associated protein
MTSELNPETSSGGGGGTTYYSYDSDATCGTNYGDMIKRVDAAGNVTCYHYDGLHRLTQVNYPSGPNTANMPGKYFYYDAAQWNGLTLSNPKGRLIGALTAVNTIWPSLNGFSYDAAGEVTDYYQASSNSGGWYHVQQSYNPVGQRVVLQGFLNNGSALSHYFWYDTYEGEGRQRGVADGTPGTSYPYVWAATTYNPAGLPGALAMPGLGTGTWENFTYDSASNRMTQWSSSNSAVGKSQTGTLTWNANGTLKQLQISDSYNAGDNNLNCTHSYDDLARLASANCGTPWNQTFSYDQYSNITKAGSVNFNPGYNSANNHVSGFSYDGMGNVTNDGSRAYSYDAEGRAITANGVTIIYDALGRAVDMGSAGQIVYDASGNKFAYMNGQTVQKYMVPLAAGLQAVYNASGLQYYRHADWLGSSRLQLDTSGYLYGGRAYAPFGESYAEAGTADRSFTGQTQDMMPGSTGVYDFLFRQNSAAQGRWLVPDPAGVAAVDLTNPQTWNRYAYVANNPLSNVDPLGLADCTVVFGGVTQGPGSPGAAGQTAFANSVNGILAFPFSGEDTPVIGAMQGGLEVAQQGVFGGNSNTNVGIAALSAAAQNSGNINIVAISGGAQTFATALSYLPGLRDRINNVTYIMPGSFGATLPTGFKGSTTLVDGRLASLNGMIVGNVPFGANLISVNCGHDPNCAFAQAGNQIRQLAGGNCSKRATFTKGGGGSGGGFGGGGIWTVLNSGGFFNWGEMGWASGAPTLTWWPTGGHVPPMQGY